MKPHTQCFTAKKRLDAFTLFFTVTKGVQIDTLEFVYGLKCDCPGPEYGYTCIKIWSCHQ
ncbi:hypothetical protein FIBSPDRAFT_854559 [Athelia psychrophila]|uniref:Uncharacterized protein n=1 Tax=Athelia psychrophila TaxID=1759441 RepID=A0A166Q7U3_9AGAM|nr:hypothetical protein FIBSPDRAFT_854559 [Fibularhizoctonia sp. CBS 109695]